MFKPNIYIILALGFFSLFTMQAQDEPEPRPELQIEIRQSQFHDDFTKRELRNYRLIGRKFTLIVEKFDDPEAEVAFDKVLDGATLFQLKQLIERNRVMDTEFGCEMISRDTRTKLKTEIRIFYEGNEVSCYSFDQPFARQIEEVLKAINEIMPMEKYKLAIPSLNPRIEVGQ